MDTRLWWYVVLKWCCTMVLMWWWRVVSSGGNLIWGHTVTGVIDLVVRSMYCSVFSFDRSLMNHCWHFLLPHARGDWTPSGSCLPLCACACACASNASGADASAMEGYLCAKITSLERRVVGISLASVQTVIGVSVVRTLYMCYAQCTVSVFGWMFGVYFVCISFVTHVC